MLTKVMSFTKINENTRVMLFTIDSEGSIKDAVFMDLSRSEVKEMKRQLDLIAAGQSGLTHELATDI